MIVLNVECRHDSTSHPMCGHFHPSFPWIDYHLSTLLFFSVSLWSLGIFSNFSIKCFKNRQVRKINQLSPVNRHFPLKITAKWRFLLEKKKGIEFYRRIPGQSPNRKSANYLLNLEKRVSNVNHTTKTKIYLITEWESHNCRHG